MTIFFLSEASHDCKKKGRHLHMNQKDWHAFGFHESQNGRFGFVWFCLARKSKRIKIGLVCMKAKVYIFIVKQRPLIAFVFLTPLHGEKLKRISCPN